jgi:hypothetical protein
MPAAAHPLRLRHGEAGEAIQFLRMRGIPANAHDADGGSDADLAARKHEGFRQGRHDGPRHGSQLGIGGRAEDDGEELVCGRAE